VAVKAKELRHAVELDPVGTLRTEDGSALDTAEPWTPEHLLLAALLRCSVKALRYHADRAGIAVKVDSGGAASLVTKRESDGRYGVVSVDVSLDVELDPRPVDDDLAELLQKAERDCFIGASLRAEPSYHWSVRGAPFETT
jgi:organic hydroperoxide reductase OsmC/OhrA